MACFNAVLIKTPDIFSQQIKQQKRFTQTVQGLKIINEYHVVHVSSLVTAFSIGQRRNMLS